MIDPRPFLVSLFDAAVAAADPARALEAYIPEKPIGRTVVIGAGKGAAHLARAFETLWDGPLEGVAVTRYGFAVPCSRIPVLEAAHPVPDTAGLAAASRIRDAVSGLSEDDLVVALISGGGSALLPAPPEGLDLSDEIDLNEALLSSGAPISAMNTIRKHVSTIKGGRLAALAAPARVVTLVVSDVPGDNPAFVASGPTVPDAATRADALKLVERYRIALPDRILHHLQRPAADAPTPDDPVFARNAVHVIASAGLSLEAAARQAERQGVAAAILSDSVEGEAREAARTHAAIAREVAGRGRPFSRPVVLLSGGETTVTLGNLAAGTGKGGPNTEFLLSLAQDIAGIEGIHALSADTDGIDGSEDNAGAFADATSVERLRARGGDAAAFLDGNDAWSAFERIGDLFSPGPTGTNVNDFRAIFIA